MMLAELKQIERKILLLYYVEGYSDLEIANALDLSVVAIKKKKGQNHPKAETSTFQSGIKN